MQVHAPSPTVLVRFGVFELDLRTGELRKAGARLRLSNQAFIVLAELLERPHELVTREELRIRLWPTDTFVDFEHGLNAAVRKVREVLGDSAITPRYIETLPRRGYRFVASVQRVPPRCDDPTTNASRLRSRFTGALLEWGRTLFRPRQALNLLARDVSQRSP